MRQLVEVRRRAVAGLVATLVATGVLAAAPAQADTRPVDGLTSATAAASCWEIKQAAPSATDGVYWLSTPTLGAPERFYCDMTTDGGGWVLVGRGRNDWSASYQGKGQPSQVHEAVSGPAAFAPRQLPSATIDGLLDGGRVDALPDGIRLRRATNAEGTTWQEARLAMARRDRWVWTFGAEHPLARYTIDGVTRTGGQTVNVGTNSAFRRIDTRAPAERAWTWGFAYGSQVQGSPSDTGHLWHPVAGGGSAVPFTQMYVRPQLLSSQLTWPALPDAGTPARTLPPLLSNGAEPQAWGVTGLANGKSGELNVEVQAFTQVGSTVYVGGNFRFVQRGSAATGDDRVEQPYLAAFDVTTGEWVRSFRPRLDGQVLALAGLPDGRLVVGGEFRTANGAPAPALVALDPATGATDTSWTVAMENRITGGVLRVRALEVQGPWLYIGGGFTHLSGGTRSNPVYARHGARVDAASATPDTWNPAFDGTVVDLDASESGDRLYAAGYFTQVGGQPANRAAALSTGPTAELLPGWNHVSSGTYGGYQQAVMEAGGRVWLGGSQHSLFSYDRTSFQRLSGNIAKSGGDFQAVAEVGGVLYAGCHCNEWNYSGASTWPTLGSTWTQADRLGFVGAWDPATGAVLPEFNPTLRARAGHGPWAIFEDSTGRTWFGGDFVSSARADGSTQWVGGFARFAPRDAAAPTAPAQLSSVPTQAGTTVLSWTGSLDDRPGVRYQVLRDDRVVATSDTTSLTVPSPVSAAERYAVRAVDATGNLSASTPVHVLDPAAQAPPEPAQLVAMGSTWAWAFDGVDRGTAWREPGYDDTAWNRGPGRIGFNIGGESTLIPTSGTGAKPVTAYYRSTFEVAGQASRYTTLALDLVRDDGAVVYLNGVELLRDNMPDGEITATTGATTTVSSTWAARTPVSYRVPASALRDGLNTIAVEVHQNHAWGNDMSFDLRVVATG